jgi:phosphatidate cytidylyltransferase
MAKSRRNVQFPRRGSNAQDRPSFGDHDASAPTSPLRAYANGKEKEEAVSEEVCASTGVDLYTTNNSQEVEDPQPSEYEKKKQTFITRTIWSLVMIGGFFVALFSGHIYIIALITAIQLISFKEVIAIANVPSKAKNLRFTKSLNWYFLGTAMYYLYGESVVYYFKHIVLVDKVLLPFATHHRFIGFMLYVIGMRLAVFCLSSC